MVSENSEFGVLTLATPADWKKAIGLARSLRRSNPSVPIAVACSDAIAAKLGRHFDRIIQERTDLVGFEHKLYLDQYTPFKKNCFP